MTINALDFAFPFVVFFYGFVVTVVLNSKFIAELGETKMPHNLWMQFQSHRVLALVCLIIGGIWSIQNLVL